jgi:hypothetical protein
VAEVIEFLFLRILFLKSRQGLFKPADAPKNMAPIDTTTTAVAVSSETSQGNHLTGNRTHLFSALIYNFFLKFIPGNIKQKASAVGNYLDDRLFGRNETVLTLNEVKRIDP